MKSFVSNGRSTIDRLHDGIRLTGSRSKCTGIKITGICAIFFIQPDAARVQKVQISIQNVVSIESTIVIKRFYSRIRTVFTTWSACRNCAKVYLEIFVSVMSVIGYWTEPPKMKQTRLMLCRMRGIILARNSKSFQSGSASSVDRPSTQLYDLESPVSRVK